ncbi:MAG: glutamate racemase [Proteobacteria bacterium]|nr:glutamate racemase [Cystobacterineae bacterium]MCL2258227.1 glutamate racemase [Cystobacterineae bacterium]MCL2315429.1 glutamate racemase [Pseudomonadota bacterium]
MSPSNRPIGVFDSGLGGLTVLKALQQLLPQENTVYLGDLARLPYGNKSAEVVCRYAQEAAAFLLGHSIKLLVVACNTASALALEGLQKRLSIPVVGVIVPGAQQAAKHTRNGRIAVLGTLGTIRSKAYHRALLDIQPSLCVFAQPCPLFVPLVEEGWLQGEVTTLVARHYIQPVIEFGADTVVLGCTHYPLLAPTLEAVLCPEVQLVDSAVATAQHVSTLLRLHALCANTPQASHLCFVTDEPERFAQQAERFLGHPLSNILLCRL